MEIETLIALLLLAGYYFWFAWSEIRDNRKAREEQIARRVAQRIKQEKTAIARCKNERIGSFWKCRYFKHGDQLGFFRQKPSSERVVAEIGPVDPELQMHELFELGPAEEHMQMTI